MGAAIADECSEVLNGAGAGVVDWGVFGACGVELYGREALNFIWDVVGGGVYFCDGDFVKVVVVEAGEVFVFGGEAEEC